jgi:hypothetical protein
MPSYGAIMNLNTKLIVVIVAAGIIAATITMLGTPKVLNMATAQLRVPFLPQQQQPVQQQPNGPATTATTTSTSGNGPNCVGCITTQNLADGAVTNPKLGPLSVSSGNIGAGQVATGNIADQAVTTSKLASGAVTMTSQSIGLLSGVAAGATQEAVAQCPTGTIATGGGYAIAPGADIQVIHTSPAGLGASNTAWSVLVHNSDTTSSEFVVDVVCAKLSP